VQKRRNALGKGLSALLNDSETYNHTKNKSAKSPASEGNNSLGSVNEIK
jgi:ParB family chromosome partitioning protein